MQKSTKSPSYILKRGDVYYFRCVLPSPLNLALNRPEIRLSLAKRERSRARVKAQRAFKAISDIAISPQKAGGEGLDQFTQDQIRAVKYGHLEEPLKEDYEDRFFSGK